MEFWEGAILIVGGVWLVGRMHRNQVGHLAVGVPSVASPARKVPGPTSATNTDGSGSLVLGETLHTGLTGNIPQPSCPGCGSGLTSIIARRPVARPVMPTAGSGTPVAARSMVRRPVNMAVQF